MIVLPRARPAPSALRLAALAALAVAAALLAAWFWSRYCRFPTVPWNDLRLAPTIALAQGWPIYPTATAGTINTWMYGPLPVLFHWPATWASTAAGALLVAGALNLALTLLPLALVCLLWPAADPGADSKLARAIALGLTLAIWPELHYSVIFSDNLALACGLLGMLLLVRGGNRACALWLAALLGAAAVGCKQIALGIPLAQIVWLGVTAGRVAAGQHVLRCVVAGAVVGGVAIAIFGWEGLWFTLVKIPGSFGWANDPAGRLAEVRWVLALHIGVPLIAMTAARRAFARPALLLLALTWLCTLPLGVAGLMKLGGWTNSIHGFVLWLPAALVTLLTAPWAESRRHALAAAAALATVAIASGRLMTEDDLPFRPQTAVHDEAAQIAARRPGAVWFPMNPLVTLYSDRRYYHDEDGLYVRLMAKQFPEPTHAAAGLPPQMHTIAFRTERVYWGVAQRMLPPGYREEETGRWTLRSGVANPTPP